MTDYRLARLIAAKNAAPHRTRHRRHLARAVQRALTRRERGQESNLSTTGYEPGRASRYPADPHTTPPAPHTPRNP